MTLQEEISELKKEKDAIILAHYYVPKEVQEIADFTGDSFYLSKLAQKNQNKIIVFCGVDFMGESAKLLSPEKTVLMPDKNADCPMAHMVSKQQVQNFRDEYKDSAVVCYINSTMEIKSWSDVCVTSSNAVKIVKKLPNKNILFIPDKNLGRFVAQQVPEKNIHLIDGYCPVHDSMQIQQIKDLQKAHPKALLLAHPECTKEICLCADYIGSTSGIITYATEHSNKEYIIATEEGVLAELQRKNPQKTFYFTATTPICHGMKLITLEKIKHVLETGDNSVSIQQDQTAQAKLTLERMLSLAQ